MGRHASGEPTDARVKEARNAIAHWRRTREKQTRMPAKLWTTAVELAQTHGTYRVARRLGVDYESLARKVAEAGGKREAETEAGRFVELRGMDLLGGAMVVELLGGDGARMTIRLGHDGGLAAAATLVSAFRWPAA